MYEASVIRDGAADSQVTTACYGDCKTSGSLLDFMITFLMVQSTTLR